ncbi:hypothetical protein IAR50_005709 [Cryptococcus sp. DSM 104548]
MLVATPSTPSLASRTASSRPSVAPLTPIATPAKPAVEPIADFYTPAPLAFPADILAPLTPLAMGASKTILLPAVDAGVGIEGGVDGEGYWKMWGMDMVMGEASASAFIPASSNIAPFALHTPQTTPVKPAFHLPANVITPTASSSSLNMFAPSTPPSMGASHVIPLPTGCASGSIENQQGFEKWCMDMGMGDMCASASLPAPAPSRIAPFALHTPATTPVKPTVEPFTAELSTVELPTASVSSGVTADCCFDDYLALLTPPSSGSTSEAIRPFEVAADSQGLSEMESVDWDRLLLGMDVEMSDAMSLLAVVAAEGSGGVEVESRE